MKRLLREPLLHFTALALLIFAVYAVLAPSGQEPPAARVVVTTGKIDQLAAVFERTWQRPPAPDELKGLIDDHVQEEIYVREALALGLDRDDTVIRRRLRQKMEFIASNDVEALTPSDADLQAYLDAHPDAFAEAPQVAFQQVFLNPDRRGDRLEADALALLDTLRADPAADPALLGDGMLLPAEMPLSSATRIDRVFGPEIAAAVTQAAPGVWTGPVASPYGLHLIRVTAKVPERLPALADIRDDVLREWSHRKQQEAEAARLADLLKRFEVVIESGPPAGTAP